MPFDVKMPDGTVVKNVPDGTSKQQFMNKYNANMSKAAAPNAGDSTFSKSLQAGGQGAQMVNSAIGDVAKAAIGKVPDYKLPGFGGQGFKEGAAQGMQEAGRLISKAIPDSVKQKATEFATEHPEATRDLKAVGEMASVAPTGKIAGKVAGEATGVAPIAKGLMTPSNAKIDALVDTMHKGATSTIERAKNGGVVFDPHVGQKLLTNLDTIPDLGTAGERSTRKGTVDAIDEVRKSIENGDTSLRNLLGFRDKLTEVADQGGQDGSAALKARKAIDAAIKDAHSSGSFTAADPKAIGLVEDFRKQWGAYKTGEQVAEALKLSDESISKSKKAFKKIADSEYFQSLSPEVRKLVNTAARGKVSGNILGAIGSIKQILNMGGLQAKLPLLEGGAALATGHPGVAAGIGGVLAAGSAAKQIQRGTAMDVLNAIRNGQ